MIGKWNILRVLKDHGSSHLAFIALLRTPTVPRFPQEAINEISKSYYFTTLSAFMFM